MCCLLVLNLVSSTPRIKLQSSKGKSADHHRCDGVHPDVNMRRLSRRERKREREERGEGERKRAKEACIGRRFRRQTSAPPTVLSQTSVLSQTHLRRLSSLTRAKCAQVSFLIASSSGRESVPRRKNMSSSRRPLLADNWLALQSSSICLMSSSAKAHDWRRMVAPVSSRMARIAR